MLLAVLEAQGHVPLPPYIVACRQRRRTWSATRRSTRARRARSPRRPRACTSPPELLERLRARGVQLASRRRCTSAPARSSRCAASDWPSTACTASGTTIPRGDGRGDRTRRAGARPAHRRRGHDHAARAGIGGAATAGDVASAGAADTRLFIVPGYRFRVVDRLLTNFHLPKSTLLMLVVRVRRHASACRAAYAHAIARALPLLQLRRRDAARALPHDSVAISDEIHLLARRCRATRSPRSSRTARSRRRSSCRSAPTAP